MSMCQGKAIAEDIFLENWGDRAGWNIVSQNNDGQPKR